MRWILTHKRLLAALVVVLLVLAAALWPESIDVDAVPVTRGPLQYTLAEEGETRVRERFVVSAPLAGRLARIELEPGDPVTQGETVVAELSPLASPLLDPRTRSELEVAVAGARAALGQARAERARAETEVTRARSSYGRIEQLARSNAISEDELEAAQTALTAAEEARRAAEFAVRRAEAELAAAQARVGAPGSTGRALPLFAPASGVVLRRYHESEAVVPAGDRLLEIGDPARTEIVADLLSSDAVRVREGARAWVEDWGGERPLEARVRRVEPSGFTKVSALGVEEQRVNVVMDWVQPDETTRALGDAYRVEVRIVLWEADDVVRVPIGGVFRHDDGWAAFVVEDERARLRPVTLGHQSERDAHVESGLEPGELVVQYPPDTLSDGARVRVRR